MAIYRGPEIVKSNLVLYLDAANPKSYVSGSSNWNDISGRSNDAVIYNSPTFNSLNYGSLQFDGVDDYCTVSNNITPGTGDFAVSVWVYKTDSFLNRHIWDFGQNGGTLSSGTQITPGFRYYNPNIGASSPLYLSGPTYSTNTWYNIVISRISNTTYFYSNGTLVISGVDNGNIGSWGTTLTICDYGGDGSYFHEGRLAQFMVYSGKGLTSNEVIQNFNATKMRFSL